MDSLNECLQRWVRDRGRELAIWSRREGRRLTFTQLAERRDRWERLLPYEPEAPVALATGNGTAFVELLLALRRRRHPVVLLEPGPSFEYLARRCESLGVSCLLHAFPAEGDRLGDSIRWARLDLDTEAQPPVGTELVKVTSGSTGAPVGFCFGERHLLTGIDQIAAGMGIEERDRVLITIPLSHSYGFDNGVLSLLRIGTPLVLEPDFFPGPLLETLERGEVTVFPAAPPIVRALAACQWPPTRSLRLILSAGAPLDREAAADFHRASGRWVHQFYGSTETGGITFETRPDSAEAAETVGRPIPGVELGIDGEAIVSVSSRANAIGRFGGVAREMNGVVRTGDRGRITESGRLQLLGRTGDILNVGGRKVSAREIELAMGRLPGVNEVAVIGVSEAGCGDRVVAFVVGEAGAKELKQLPRCFQPREVHWLAALPHTERGKIDREHLRQLAEAGR